MGNFVESKGTREPESILCCLLIIFPVYDRATIRLPQRGAQWTDDKNGRYKHRIVASPSQLTVRGAVGHRYHTGTPHRQGAKPLFPSRRAPAVRIICRYPQKTVRPLSGTPTSKMWFKRRDSQRYKWWNNIYKFP